MTTKKRYEKLKSNGMCAGGCGRIARVGKTRCFPCALQASKVQKVRRDRARVCHPGVTGSGAP